MIPLSILDLSPVAAGSTGAQGRVDLGVGRGPGTDPATSYALRRRQSGEDDFLERFNELMLLETRGFPAGHPFHNVRAIPEDVPLPPIYLLGSSDYSAQLAGQIGAAFAFAHHFDKFDAAEAMRLYRDTFRPSPAHAKPFAILGTHVICADTDEEAEHLAKSVDLNIVRRAKGEYLPLASPEDAAAYDYTLVDRARMAQNRTRLSVGAPATVKATLMPLIEATRADELMVTSMIFSHEARKHSYELLAKVFKGA